jgi:hypothetical protein
LDAEQLRAGAQALAKDVGTHPASQSGRQMLLARLRPPQSLPFLLLPLCAPIKRY